MSAYDVEIRTPNGGVWPFSTREGNYTPEKAAFLAIIEVAAFSAMRGNTDVENTLAAILNDLDSFEIIVTERTEGSDVLVP